VLRFSTQGRDSLVNPLGANQNSRHHQKSTEQRNMEDGKNRITCHGIMGLYSSFCLYLRNCWRPSSLENCSHCENLYRCGRRRAVELSEKILGAGYGEISNWATSSGATGSCLAQTRSRCLRLHDVELLIEREILPHPNLIHPASDVSCATRYTIFINNPYSEAFEGNGKEPVHQLTMTCPHKANPMNS
jgi:hypothetical protein